MKTLKILVILVVFSGLISAVRLGDDFALYFSAPTVVKVPIICFSPLYAGLTMKVRRSLIASSGASL